MPHSKGKYHKVLSRQLRKLFSADHDFTEDQRRLVEVVDKTYREFEERYKLLENAMTISSEELTEMNRRLRADAKKNEEVLVGLQRSIRDLGGEEMDTGENDLLSVTKFLRQEINYRKAAEILIQQSENNYRGIIENLSLGMIETDLNGIVTKIYPAFTRMSGYTEDDIIGKNPFDVFIPERWHEEMLKQQEIRKDGRSTAYEASLIHKDGHEVWVLISAAPILNQAGNVIGTIGMHFDITERKQMEADLIQSRENAERALEVRESFVANISHEIRTPMNAIIGMSRLLGEADLTDQERSYQEAIQASVKHLLVIINDVLDMSKMNAGKFELDYQTANLHDTIKHISKAFEVNAHDKSITISHNIDKNVLEWYKFDEVRLTQIISNLVGNAIKFTESGEVSIGVRGIDDGLLRFEIKDTGVGIDADKIDSVFEQFTQEDETITRRFGGTGLGLSICKQLVELFGGEIGVNSKKDHGSTFWFEIPMTPAEETQEEESAFEYHDLTGTKVLLVEDNEMNQFLARTVLGEWNCEVEEAENGLEAVNKLRDQNFDVVLMDIQMPIMDGFTATTEIRKSLECDVPILALSANSLAGERDRCLQLGMNGYLSKPFDPEMLNRSIHNARSMQRLGLRVHKGSALQKLMTDMENTAPFVQTVCDNMDRTRIELDAAIREEDWKKSRHLIHSVRPVFSMVGADTLVRKLENIEKELDADKHTQLVAGHTDIIDAIALISNSIQELALSGAVNQS